MSEHELLAQSGHTAAWHDNQTLSYGDAGRSSVSCSQGIFLICPRRCSLCMYLLRRECAPEE